MVETHVSVSRMNFKMGLLNRHTRPDLLLIGTVCQFTIPVFVTNLIGFKILSNAVHTVISSD